jgi:ABC-2 type transport system permease protein
MRTFKAYFKKEIMESLRQYRYIALGLGIIIFAIVDPMMLKLLPKILKSQIPGDISSLFQITPAAAIANYVKDLVNIGNLFVIFSLGGMLSEEIHGQKLVFPYSRGSRPAGIVLAKVIHYTLAITVFTFMGFLTAYYYIGILFTGDMPTLAGVMKSATLISMYYIYNITLVVFLSSLVKKGIAAGFIVLGLNFVVMGAGKLKGIGKFMPYKLVEKANLMTLEGVAITIGVVAVISIVFVIMTIYRMNRVEVI